MKIEKLKSGMTVYTVGTYGVGNTTMRSVAVYPVRIVSVDLATRKVVASWNMNPAETFSERRWSKWRLKRPLLIKLGFNHYRLATREEICQSQKSPASTSKTPYPTSSPTGPPSAAAKE